MNKSELIENISKQADISKAKARIALKVATAGLAISAVRRRKAKAPVRAKIKTSKVVRFKPGKGLRDHVN